MRLPVIAVFGLTLAACSGPPSPPTVGGDNREPVNNPEVMALQAEITRLNGELRDAVQAQIPPSPASWTVNVTFPYAGTAFRPTKAQRDLIADYVVQAKRIEVRGRTDGRSPTHTDEQIALGRAMAAKSYLTTVHGVPPHLVSVNYVSASDYAVDNSGSIRTLNRRVEIEFFR